MQEALLEWKHIFKLDPERELSDEALERICQSGSDAVMVGGSSGVTYDNTVDLLSRIRCFSIPCILEVSSREAVAPGFDFYLVPLVLNASEVDWVVGHHQRALKDYGQLMPWDLLAAEGYIILNGASTAAQLTGSRTELDAKDVLAYALLADRLLRLPVVYLEYSGTFGDMELVTRVKNVLHQARLFYGGGIDSAAKAARAAQAADTIIVGNVIYEDLEQALQTVKAKALED
ncbi:heptaprenylglyceryl phosphate synthase [Ferviditalea candida]|uniref:Heptaprenylglyceryl phosphate synthase n=1 Tax=Ferviditalea candida TaxID=3108399 RepID=A0ABU5ZJJ1_9BACL|nr:heptaprenylglyceryl phosphate synthase [Paenibacillaceae bacterium T2]